MKVARSGITVFNPMLDYRILGTLEVAADGRVADLGPPKQRALLAILILHPNEIVPADQLIDALWGDHPPRRASHAIQVYVPGCVKRSAG